MSLKSLSPVLFRIVEWVLRTRIIFTCIRRNTTWCYSLVWNKLERPDLLVSIFFLNKANISDVPSFAVSNPARCEYFFMVNLNVPCLGLSDNNLIKKGLKSPKFSVKKKRIRSRFNSFLLDMRIPTYLQYSRYLMLYLIICCSWSRIINIRNK